MSADEYDESWAGGADMGAAKAEIARLKKLGDGLRELTAAAAKITDPEELAAIQDRNIQAFERMTAEMGLTALDRMRETLALLADPSKAAEIAAEAAERNAGLLAAAAAEIEAARDQETAKLIRQFTDRMQAAIEGGCAPAFEPFEAGPAEESDRDWGRGASPLADMPAEGDDK